MTQSKLLDPKYVRFDELVQRTRDNKDRIVANYEAVVKEALKVGLAYYRKFRISEFIVHRKNRDGLIITSMRLHQIIEDWNRTGVTLALLRDATSFEEPESRINEKAFMEKVKCDPRLPRYNEGDGRTATTACSHFIQGLKAIDQGLVPYIFKRGHTPAGGRLTHMRQGHQKNRSFYKIC